MKFHFWNTVALLFFIAVVFLGYDWLLLNSHIYFSVSLTELFIIALAVMRLIRLATYDTITAFIREYFIHKDPRTFLGTLGVLVQCPWCTGLWFSALVLFAYFATPIAWYVILILALSYIATFFQIVANLVGWSAELKKLEAQRLS